MTNDPRERQQEVSIEFGGDDDHRGHIAVRDGAPVIVDGLIRVDAGGGVVMFASVAQIKKIWFIA